MPRGSVTALLPFVTRAKSQHHSTANQCGPQPYDRALQPRRTNGNAIGITFACASERATHGATMAEMNIRHVIADSFLGNILIGLARRRRGDSGASVTILIYHDIPKAERRAFASQVHYLNEQYGFIAPADLQEVISGNATFNGTKVLLTFDDGFKSNALVVEEILNPLGIKALFFIPPGFVNAKSREDQSRYVVGNIYNNTPPPTPMRVSMTPMSWHDLERLLADGHSIGAHTVTHSRLASLDTEAEITREIAGSKQLLQEALGVAIDHFAYPFGDINSIDQRAMAVIKQHYKYCHSGVRGANCIGGNPYAILRDPVTPADPQAYLRFIVENGLEPVYRRRAKRLEHY